MRASIAFKALSLLVFSHKDNLAALYLIFNYDRYCEMAIKLKSNIINLKFTRKYFEFILNRDLFSATKNDCSLIF